MFCRINFSWAGSSERWLFFTVLKHFETSTETTAKEELGGGSSWFILFLISRFRPAIVDVGYIFQNFRPWIMKHAPTCLLNDALRGFVHALSKNCNTLSIAEWFILSGVLVVIMLQILCASLVEDWHFPSFNPDVILCIHKPWITMCGQMQCFSFAVE